MQLSDQSLGKVSAVCAAFLTLVGPACSHVPTKPELLKPHVEKEDPILLLFQNASFTGDCEVANDSRRISQPCTLPIDYVVDKIELRALRGKEGTLVGLRVIGANPDETFPHGIIIGAIGPNFALSNSLQPENGKINFEIPCSAEHFPMTVTVDYVANSGRFKHQEVVVIEAEGEIGATALKIK